MSAVNRAFTNNLTKSLRNLQNLESSGIFHYSGDNLKEHYLMIFGHTDSPYAYVPYFFKVELSDDYPFNHPKCKFICPVNTRLHPNLYVDGKVCLSILNTWSGPSWTPLMNLGTLALDLKCLISYDEPLRCEPSYETGNNRIVLAYSNYIKLVNFFKVLPKVYNRSPTSNREADIYFQLKMKEFLSENANDMIDYGNRLFIESNSRTFTTDTIYDSKIVTHLSKRDVNKIIDLILKKD